MSTRMTRMAKASARVHRKITNELVLGTMIASAASTMATSRILNWAPFNMFRSFSSEQAGRLDRKDQCHGGVEREVGNLREQRLAEIIGETDQQCADRGAAEAAHSADDHDRER